ncbi:MAG: peptidoglycan D,D-transpeptidase FtsI family protein [Acidimicrobiales bacterium]
MTKQIRNLGMFLVACYVALFLQVNRLTVFQADELQDNPQNNRQALRDFDAPRGSIATADGVVIARSRPIEDPEQGQFTTQREYPLGPRYAHITGFFNPLSIGTDGLEQVYNDELAGRTVTDITDLDSLDRFVEDFFVDEEHVGNVTLTVRDNVQAEAEAAINELGGQRASVVAIDPRDGAILAMYSNPTYDPNTLAVHDADQATAVSEALNADPTKPRLSRVYQERFAPGSTFKVVTGSAGVESGRVTPDDPDYPTSETYTAPSGGSPIPNFGGSSCGGRLFEILADSCNTAFAQMGTEDVGGDNLTSTAEAFGFNQDVPIDLPRPAESNFPVENAQDDAFRAQISIGQNEVSSTPLQMALVAAAVANGGEVMRPHVMSEIRDEDEEVIESYDPEVWTTAMSGSTAGLMQQAMIGVVEGGTAERLDENVDDDVVVGGKTGTAQLGDTGTSHAWIIGFAGPEGGDPEVAVAVIVEAQPGANEQTGGQVAAPIAARIIEQALTPITAPDEGST